MSSLKLPTEILIRICSYLMPDQLLILAITSKKLNYIASRNELWNEFLELDYHQNDDGEAKKVFMSNLHSRLMLFANLPNNTKKSNQLVKQVTEALGIIVTYAPYLLSTPTEAHTNFSCRIQ